MMGTVINPDFGIDELRTMNLLSPLDMLASVAVKVYEFEHPFKLTLNVPTFEKKPLPFNLNVKPRTYGRPRSSPIDLQALLPCLHHKRKLEQRDDHQKNNSSQFGFDRTPKKLRLVVRLQPPKLAEDYKQKISELGGSDPRFMIERRLRKSDVSNKKGSSLTMPRGNCMVDFGEIREMRVKVYYMLGNNHSETSLTFTKSCTKSAYLFSGTWNHIVESIQLKKDDILQVWSFSQKDELCFIVLKL